MRKELPNGIAIDNMVNALNSPESQQGYLKKLRLFLEFIEMNADDLLSKTRGDPRFVEFQLIKYINTHKHKNSGNTLKGIKAAVKLFLEMNDVLTGINWTKIRKYIPRSRRWGTDRAPTLQEIRDMMEAASLRVKCAISLMCSSGIRVGAFDNLKVRDFSPIGRDGHIVAGKITVYRATPDEYYSFSTPEFGKYLDEYLAARKIAGEKIDGSSPLLRDKWETSTRAYLRRMADPSQATPLSSKALKNIIGRLQLGLGQKKGLGERGEFQQVHGFRKFFKTSCQLAGMSTLNVEQLMGHSVGLNANYYRPREEDLLEDYLKAVPNLTLLSGESARALSLLILPCA